MSTTALRDLPQVRIVIPLPPSTNNLFVNTNGGRGITRVKSKKYRDWLKAAGWSARIAAGSAHFTQAVRVLVEIDLARNRDLDNALKPVLDLLVWVKILDDDNLVDDLRIVRSGSKTEAVVSIWPI